MTPNITATAKRIEGRLFSEGNRLCMVVHVDSEEGIAQVSSRVDGRRQLLLMTIAEVTDRLASGLQFDALGATKAASRIVEKSDGWFFQAREGDKGPYRTSLEAERALSKLITEAQLTNNKAR
jgi:hypothetical protein